MAGIHLALLMTMGRFAVLILFPNPTPVDTLLTLCTSPTNYPTMGPRRRRRAGKSLGSSIHEEDDGPPRERGAVA